MAVVKLKRTSQVYAMKIMNKWDMLKRGEVSLGRSDVAGRWRGPWRLFPAWAPKSV